MGIAWLFPGQGSQFVGMGVDVLRASVAARRVFECADGVLGESLSRIVLEGPNDVLTLTANAQPAIVATSCAFLAALRERIPELPEPTFAAGHSLGEYSALVSAAALSLEDAIRLVRARGLAMQAAVPEGSGAMSAILGISPARLDAICAEAAQGEIVSPANYNAPGQIVVAGHVAAVGRVGEIVTAEKGRVIPLKVSAPFHCALMAPAAHALEISLRSVEFASPRFSIVANFDATAHRDHGRIKGLLVNQVVGAVRWEQSVHAMAAAGVTHALEIGPGRVLSGLVKRTAKDLKVLSVCDLAAFDRVPGFLAEVANAERQRVQS